MSALAELSCEDSTVLLHRAQAQNLPAIVALLADDQLGMTRDGATDVEGLAPYLRAFSATGAQAEPVTQGSLPCLRPCAGNHAGYRWVRLDR